MKPVPAWLRRLSDCTADLLFPPACTGCGERLEPFTRDRAFLCPFCRAAFAASGQACRLQYPVGADGANESVHVSLCLYDPKTPDGVPQRVIYRIKHNRDRRVFDGLGRALAAGIRRRLDESGIRTDCVICAYPPRKAATARREGVDQARELARSTAKHLGVPCVPLFVRARRSGTAQKQLSAADRQTQAASAYRLNDRQSGKAAGKCVILVDDVCTTGATLDALTVLARGAGAADVIRACVGRTASRS